MNLKNLTHIWRRGVKSRPDSQEPVWAGSPSALQSVSAVVSEGIWGQVLLVFNLNAKIRAHTASGGCQENMLPLYQLMKILLQYQHYTP